MLKIVQWYDIIIKAKGENYVTLYFDNCGFIDADLAA